MKKVLYLLLAGSVLLSCAKREDDVSEGPNITDIFGDFQMLADFVVEDETVDFSAGETTHFNAIFNKLIDWEIQITGLSSGSVKRITGTSSEITSANSLWGGNTTELPMFSTEECAVQLSFATNEFIFHDTLEITGVKTNEAFIIADFETGWNSDWLSFVQSGADMSFTITDNVFPGEGNYYYDMGGEVNWDWLIGMIEFPADAFENGYDVSDDPSEVYFNAFLNVPEEINNELILFQFREDENEDGNFNESTEDMYSIEISGLSPGWQHIYVRYSDLVVLVNGQPAAPNGNAIHEPHKLDKISVLFLADPSSGYSQTLMDYVVFTEGGPLNP